MILYGTNPIAWSNDDDQSLGADISLEQCLREAAAIGFDGIERGHKMPSDPRILREVLLPHGLQLISGWHSLNLLTRPVEHEIQAIQPHLDLLKAMGCQICIVCETSNAVYGCDDIAVNDRPVLASEKWREFGAAIEDVAQHCADQDLTLVYHHHVGTVVETPGEIDRLMEVSGPATKLLFDTGHCYLGGGDPVQVYARHASRTAHLHAKNVRHDVMQQLREEGLSFLDGVRRGVFTVPGDTDGALDFTSVLATAACQNYRGWLVIEAEQDPDTHDPFEYQNLGLKTLKRIAREVRLDSENINS